MKKTMTLAMFRGSIPVAAVLALVGCLTEEAPAESTPTITPAVHAATPTPGMDDTLTGSNACPVEAVPSSNHWVAYQVPEDLSGTGWRVGDTLPDFTLVDQFGDPVSLYQFYGMVIMIEVGAVWCPYCNDTAQKSKALYESYSEDCVMFLYLLTQDEAAEPVTQDDVEYWAERYALDYPVLGDVGEEISGQLGVKALPTFYFVDRNMVLSSKTMGENFRDIVRSIDALL